MEADAYTHTHTQFQATHYLYPKDLAQMTGVTTSHAVVAAEPLVLNALEWNLNLLTPAHFVCAIGAYDDDRVAYTLDMLSARFTSWVAAPWLRPRPSLCAAILLEKTHPTLLETHCADADADELAQARTLFSETP